jgi:hypothetical protein
MLFRDLVVLLLWNLKLLSCGILRRVMYYMVSNVSVYPVPHNRRLKMWTSDLSKSFLHDVTFGSIALWLVREFAICELEKNVVRSYVTGKQCLIIIGLLFEFAPETSWIHKSGVGTALQCCMKLIKKKMENIRAEGLLVDRGEGERRI